MMRQVQYAQYIGGSSALQHVDVPIPEPQAEEILVKVEVAGVNPLDWRLQEGIARPILPRKFPFVPGTDIAGEVVRLGPGVTGFNPGDKVIAYIDVMKGGSLAEYAIVSVKTCIIRPEGVSAEEGASIVVPGFTALQSVRQSGITSVKGGNEHLNVLITGASGGVGILAVQLVKLGGAHVTVTCGARNMDLMRSLGADEALDYRTPEGDRYESSISGHRYDVVLQCAHFVPLARFEAVLKPVAKVIDLTPTFMSLRESFYNKIALFMMLKKSSHVFENFFMGSSKADLELMAGLVREGKLKVVVDSKFPLGKAGDAWDRSIGRHATGKILVCNSC